MKRARDISQHTFVLIPVLLVATFALEPVALAVTPRWIPTGNLNILRSGHTATLLRNGKVLVVGGDSSGSASCMIQSLETGISRVASTCRSAVTRRRYYPTVRYSW